MNRVVPLNVARAFHTPLMAAAGDDFARRLKAAGIHNRVQPVSGSAPLAFSNVTGAAYRAGGSADETCALLTQHISSGVQFEEQIKAMYAAGARVFVEFGSSLVYSSDLAGTPHPRTTYLHYFPAR